MSQASKRAGYHQDGRDMDNEHLGYNEARYPGRAYNQDFNQNKIDQDDNRPGYNQYQNSEEHSYHRHNQQSYHTPRPGSDPGADPGYGHNYRHNSNAYRQDQNRPGRGTGYRGWNDDINADRGIQGSRNYMREEQAYGQSNDRMYEADRGNSPGRQHYQDDYNYNNNAQYPYRGNLDAYDTNFDNPENFRKQRRRGFGSRYER